MNKRTLDVLAVVSKISKDGESAVIESSDFFNAVPNLNAEELDDIIKELALTECVKLRYHKDNDYCLTTLPKGKIIVESDVRTKKGVKSSINDSSLSINIDYKKIAKTSFTSGFLGAFIAGVIMLAVYLIIEFVG
ncbi:MAG: hypothetical protein LBF12_03575 [Christensenellaceae bacterium]|jgi:predicted transcriptional regulator|nr:hypothetical protein [Christensenellaceae bacterium]